MTATFNEVSSQQLRILCSSLGLQHSYPEFLLLQRFLFESWGEQEIPKRPRYPSLIGDDHSPYEYSVAFNGDNIELRLLLEAQASLPSLVGNRESAFQLTGRIANIFSLKLQRLHAIVDVLCPPDPQGQFSVWHAVSLHENRSPSFKIYLNPQVRGKDRANSLIEKAFERLGFRSAASRLFERLASQGSGLNDLSYFSLDLADQPSARVKVYFCHPGATAANLEHIFSVAPSHAAGDVTQFCLDMVGHTGPFDQKPVSSCFSFVEGSEHPLAATFHLPIAHYAESDELITQRIVRFLRKHGMKSERYSDLIHQFATRSTLKRTGIQSYASYRREGRDMRLTAYLSPGLYENAGQFGVFDHTIAADSFASAGIELFEASRREHGRLR